MLDRPFSVFPNHDGSFMVLFREGDEKRVQSFSNKLDLFVFLEAQFDLSPAPAPQVDVRVNGALTDEEVEAVRAMLEERVQRETDAAWEQRAEEDKTVHAQYVEDGDAATDAQDGWTGDYAEGLRAFRAGEVNSGPATVSTGREKAHFVDGVRLESGDTLLWKDVFIDYGTAQNDAPSRPSALRRFLGNLRVL